jgi:hypothetical protein
MLHPTRHVASRTACCIPHGMLHAHRARGRPRLVGRRGIGFGGAFQRLQHARRTAEHALEHRRLQAQHDRTWGQGAPPRSGRTWRVTRTLGWCRTIVNTRHRRVRCIQHSARTTTWALQRRACARAGGRPTAKPTSDTEARGRPRQTTQKPEKEPNKNNKTNKQTKTNNRTN